MIKFTKNEIEEARKNLPKLSLRAIDHIEWKKYIEESMGTRFSYEKIEKLKFNTELLLLGIIDPQNYAFDLENTLGISSEEAQKTLILLNDLIFKKIQNQIEEYISEEIITQENNDVPLPPYSKIVNKKNEDMQENPSTSRVQEAEEEKEEENVLQKNSVEISKEEIEKIPLPKKDFLQKESKILIDSGIDLFEEERGGENKNNLLKDKIINTSITTHNTSDRSNDSYREPIE